MCKCITKVACLRIEATGKETWEIFTLIFNYSTSRVTCLSSFDSGLEDQKGMSSFSGVLYLSLPHESSPFWSTANINTFKRNILQYDKSTHTNITTNKCARTNLHNIFEIYQDKYEFFQEHPLPPCNLQKTK